MVKGLNIFIFVTLLSLCNTRVFAQEGEDVPSDEKAMDKYEELASKIDELQKRINNLSVIAGGYAMENQRLKEENKRLQSELFVVNDELAETKNLADETSKRFDTSVVNIDQRDQMRYDYNRRIGEDYCQDAWGTEDDRDQCARQVTNFDTLDSIMKSR